MKLPDLKDLEVIKTHINEKLKNKIRFELKEDTIQSDDSSNQDLDSDGDGLPDPGVLTSDEEV